jgi:hypothetical protein
VRADTGRVERGLTDRLFEGRSHRIKIMLRDLGRDSLVVLRGRRDIRKGEACVRWTPMSLETQDTLPKKRKHLDLPMPETERSSKGVLAESA